MSVRIDRLESMGLVRRESDPDDGRGVLVALTPAGLAAFDAAAPAHLANEARLLAPLAPAERAALAASIGQAADGASTMFVIAYVALRLILIGLFARVRPAAPAQVRPFIERYLLGNGAGAVVWLASLAVPEPARYALWVIALGIEIGTPIWAVTTFRGQPYVPRIFHPGHIRERYGLFTLIVLGESILAVAAGTAERGDRARYDPHPCVGITFDGRAGRERALWPVDRASHPNRNQRHIATSAVGR